VSEDSHLSKLISSESVMESDYLVFY